MDDAENLDIQADSGQLTADERNVAQGSLEPVGATTEQLKAEEKTVRQAGKEAPDGDTQEEDSKQAAEEGSTQENELKQKKKKTEVSWENNKLKATLQGKGNSIFLDYMDFWN